MTEEQTEAPQTEEAIALPTPRELGVRVMTAPNGKDVLLLDVLTIYGPQSYALDADSAEKLGQGLIDAARMLRTGIVAAPQSGLVLPGRQ